MQHWLKYSFGVLFLALALTLANSSLAWASPAQSPARQTVPTRIKTETPTNPAPLPTDQPKTKIPTAILPTQPQNTQAPTALPPTQIPPASSTPGPVLPTGQILSASPTLASTVSPLAAATLAASPTTAALAPLSATPAASVPAADDSSDSPSAALLPGGVLLVVVLSLWLAWRFAQKRASESENGK